MVSTFGALNAEPADRTAGDLRDGARSAVPDTDGAGASPVLHPHLAILSDDRLGDFADPWFRPAQACVGARWVASLPAWLAEPLTQSSQRHGEKGDLRRADRLTWSSANSCSTCWRWRRFSSCASNGPTGRDRTRRWLSRSAGVFVLGSAGFSDRHVRDQSSGIVLGLVFLALVLVAYQFRPRNVTD